MIVVVGLSHKTAPIEVRERLALPDASLPEILRDLVRASGAKEAMIVSTCNRVEFVVAGGDGSARSLEELARQTGAAVLSRAPGVEGHIYRRSGRDAIEHLFRVAASLDSMVVGEPQFLGQVKNAYDVAREAGTVGPVLHRVVPRALKAAKRVRSETGIGSGQVSVPSVAVDLGRQIFGDLSQHTAALIGSGEMGETVSRLLSQAGSRLIVLGRNTERVKELAGAMGAEPRLLPADLERTLGEADVVVTATSASGFVIDESQVRAVRKVRRGRSLFVIDLAVPRDVDPRVGGLDGVFLYNVDDLSTIVAASVAKRREESERGERIVLEEAANYDRWAEAEQVTPTIVKLREKLSGILGVEVDRSLSGKLRHLGAEDKEALRVMVEAALNKMLHPMTKRLRSLAQDPATREDLGDAVEWLSELFELPPEAERLAGSEATPVAAPSEPPPPAPARREDAGEPGAPDRPGGVREAS